MYSSFYYCCLYDYCVHVKNTLQYNKGIKDVFRYM